MPKHSRGYLHFEGHRKVYQRKDNANILFVMYLTRTELDRARKAGFTVFSLESTKKYIQAGAGYVLDNVAVRLIKDE